MTWSARASQSARRARPQLSSVIPAVHRGVVVAVATRARANDYSDVFHRLSRAGSERFQQPPLANPNLTKLVASCLSLRDAGGDGEIDCSIKRTSGSDLGGHDPLGRRMDLIEQAARQLLVWLTCPSRSSFEPRSIVNLATSLSANFSERNVCGVLGAESDGVYISRIRLCLTRA